jgi:NAD+-dependent protein deacetylase SIR2
MFHSSALNDAECAPFFYKMMASLKDKVDVTEPTPTHYFINALDQQNQLLRLYTQNIDGLETKAGMSGMWGAETTKKTYPKPRMVMVHGVLDSVRCRLCSGKFPWTRDYNAEFGNGRAPNCPTCSNRGM